ncbi:MAG: methyltransferase domain-containing protein, partial [Anaerolineae bacterium]|nr:methyltransferase domain-containing protein [Anaerolineae bacterium]
FANESFMLVVAKDSLEHFEFPEKVIREVERVLKPAGTLVIWVPFLYPFHGDDYWRFTPLVLKRMLIRFRIVRFDTPLWVFSILSLAIIDLMKRMRLGCLEQVIRNWAWRLDRICLRLRPGPRSFAGAYLIVAELQE